MNYIKLFLFSIGFFILHFQSNSQVLQLSISDNNNANVSGDYIVQLPDGSNIVLGKQYNLNNSQIDESDILLYRVMKDGSILWQKRYRGNQLKNEPSHLLIASNGDVLLSFNSCVSTHNNSDGYLMRVNPTNGNTIWSRRLRYSDNGSNRSNAGEVIFQFVEINNNRILCVGTENRSPGVANSMITVFQNVNTLNPIIQYSEVFDWGNKSDEFYSVVTDGISCYISGSVIGASYNDVQVIKYQPSPSGVNGTFLWTNVFDYNTTKGDCTWGGKLTLKNGNLYLSTNSGNNYSGNISLSSDLIQIDTINGNALNIKTFNAPNLNYSNSGFNLFLNNGEIINIQNPANQLYDATTLQIGNGSIIPNSIITKFNTIANTSQSKEINLQGTQSIYGGIVIGNNMDLIGASFDNNIRSAYLFKTITSYENANPFSCALDSSMINITTSTPANITGIISPQNIQNVYMNNIPVQEFAANLSTQKLCGSFCDFEVTLSSNNIIYCNNQSFTINSTIFNGKIGTSYSYQWYDQNGTPIGTSSNLTSSGTGVYRLVVKGLNQGDTCTSFATFNVSQLQNPIVISGNTELCDTSSNSSGVNLSASGINGTYLWSTGATTQTINVKAPGVYSVSVTVNGCVLTKQITVKYTHFENNIERNCSRGLVFLSSKNQNNGNSYLWSNGSTTSSISVNTGGWYYLTVTNSSGCSTIDSIEANCCDSNLFVDIIGDSIICNNEDITLEAQNNFNNPQYQWSHNLGSNSTAVVNSPGTYYVTVCESSSEEQGTMCCKIDSFKVSYNNFIEIIGDSIFCSSIGLNPDLNIHTTNNISQITWTFPDGSQSNVNTITANQAGIFIVNVTDENGCIGSDTFNVVENCCAGFHASILFSKDTVCYQKDSVVVSALPNNAASYQWNTGQSTQSFSLNGTGIGSHIYTVTVTDNNGCIDSVSDTLFMKDCFPPCGSVVILSNRITSNKTTICNNGKESAVLTVSPAGLNRVWSTGATLSSISVNIPGKYWVVTTDSLGCKDSSSFILLGKVCDTVNCDSINFGISSSSDSICITKKENVLITAYPSNAIYSWSPISSTNQSISINAAGTYLVTITFNSCVKILKKVISTSECKSCTDTCDWHLNGNDNVQTYNFIGSKNNADFKIRTNNIERAIVKGDGKIGVGTSTPTEQLHSTQGVRFEGLSKLDSPKRIVVQDNTGKLYWSDALSFKGSKGDKGDQGPQGLKGDKGDTGSQGVKGDKGDKGDQGIAGLPGPRGLPGATGPQGPIGLTGPQGPVGPSPLITNTLTLVGNTLTSTVSGIRSNTITLPSATVDFWSLGGNTNITSTNNILGITNANSNPLRFFTNNSEKMTILANGNVGIGTTSPSSIFNVISNNNVFKFNNGNGSQTPTFSIINNSNSTGKAAAFIAGTAGTGLIFDNSGSFVIGVEPKVNFSNNTLGGSTSLLMTILANGNVGIGTTSPATQLHTTGAVRFAGITQDNSFTRIMVQNSNGDVRWKDASSFGTGNTTNSCNVNGSIPRLNGTNSYTCSQIYDNGTSVGVGAISGFTYNSYSGATIGSNVPLSSGNVKLEVNGVLRSTMSIVTSDGKLKTEVKDLKEALSIVKSLKGKTYNWSSEFQKKSGVDNGRHIGFIAQEIREVLPELVIEDENKQLGVNYTELIPVLVEAIKDQQNQIDALKSGNKISSIAPSSNVDIDAMNKEMIQLKSENQMFKEKFELLEKSISLLCESGCAGLEKAKQNAEDVDILYQSIPNPTDNEALINFYLSKKYNNASIQINSLEGKSMETIVLDASQGKGSVKIQLGQYAAQTYFYSLIVENKVVDTKKLTVIR